MGFGLYGKKFTTDWVYAYEVYLTNGFDDKIIANTENRTFLPASKENKDRFEESFNGSPLLTGKFAIKHRKVGELGLSYMGGVYNKFKEDGLVLDKKRRVKVVAVDFNSTLPGLKTFLNGEWAWTFVNLPDHYTEQFGGKQRGGFVDIVQPVIRKRIFDWDNAVINIALRAEYADYNVGRFRQTGGNIYDNVTALVPAISFRPTAQTVFRANYRHEWHRDLLGNPATKVAGFQIGISTYF